MLQAADLTLDDFEQLEGCNEILNVTRPDVVRAVHEAYFEAGADASRPTRSAANLGQPRRVRHRRPDPRAVRGGRRASPARSPTSFAHAGPAALGARLDGPRHQAADPRPRRLRELRDAYQRGARGMIEGGADAILVETCQDLLQIKAAVLGARAGDGRSRPARCR